MPKAVQLIAIVTAGTSLTSLNLEITKAMPNATASAVNQFHTASLPSDCLKTFRSKSYPAMNIKNPRPRLDNSVIAPSYCASPRT